MMQKAAKKGNQQKNTRQHGSKVSHPREKKNSMGSSSTLQETHPNGLKSARRRKADQSKKTSTEVKGTQKVAEKAIGNRKKLNVRCEKDTTKFNFSPKAPRTIQGINNKHQRKTKRNNKVTESEEDKTESTAGNSAEVTEDEVSDVKEEEHGSSEESVETQSSEDETEDSDIPRNTEQTANNDSDEDLSEETKSGSDCGVKLFESSQEEGEENKKEVNPSAAVTSDEGQETEITHEDSSKRPTADKTCRQHRQTPHTSKPARESKYKMFKKTKPEKLTAEKHRTKAEKRRLEKETKQKIKDEKKNKMPQKAEKISSATKAIQPLGISLGKNNTKGKFNSTKQTKNISKKDAPVKADTTDHDYEDDEDKPTLMRACKGHKQILLLKDKGKDFKAMMELEKHQDTGGVDQGQPQRALLRKDMMTSLRHKPKKILAKPDEEISQDDVLDGDSNKLKESLIVRRTGMATLCRVSGWIQKYKPKGLNLRKRLSAWTKAVGISHWLSIRSRKLNQGPKIAKGSILKHRMEMRVASKTSLANKYKMAKEKACLPGKVRKGGDDAVPAGEKDAESKYAVVFPRMNEPAKANAAEMSQAVSLPSTPSSVTESLQEPVSTELKSKKSFARLVPPVEPDLSLPKSIHEPLPGSLSSGGVVTAGTPGSSSTPEGSSNTEARNRSSILKDPDGVRILQAARGKLDPYQINLTKISFSGGTIGSNHAKGLEPERDARVGIIRSVTQPFQNGDAGQSAVQSLYEEEADREVAQLMGETGIHGITQPEVHWTGNPCMSGDPQVCYILGDQIDH